MATLGMMYFATGGVVWGQMGLLSEVREVYTPTPPRGSV